MTGSSSGESFWPATFQERGATVPFTTPILASARVRQPDDQKLELLVPGMSGTKGTYVIPWASLPEIFKMTVHDRALYEEIADANVSTPHEIRVAALKVARTGLAGPGVAKAARDFLEELDNHELLARFFLIVRTLEQLSDDKTNTSLEELVTEEGKRRVKRALGFVALDLGINADELYDRLEKWGTAVTPIGIVDTPVEGPLRKLSKRLLPFSRALSEWAASETGDSIADAQLCADTAQETQRFVMEVVVTTDRLASKVSEALNEWTDQYEVIVNNLHRISWLLDGWEILIKMWAAAEPEPKYRQRETLVEMVRLLPLIPQNEMQAAQQATWNDLTKSMRRQVRVLESWTTGEIDIDLMLRLERYKSMPT
ncbi:MAG: hypothetical protein HYR63_26810 [Proteobacteria bacterium]|nr:hypothetical protein [Pseudomonadota bacterium]MBI3498835.1 hypothetical protein [Pseudomonadota bacterium]